jgi:hypothetical protein
MLFVMYSKFALSLVSITTTSGNSFSTSFALNDTFFGNFKLYGALFVVAL